MSEHIVVIHEDKWYEVLVDADSESEAVDQAFYLKANPDQAEPGSLKTGFIVKASVERIGKHERL